MADPVVSCAWLAARLPDPQVRVVDTRWYLADPDQGNREYVRSHLPGAVFMDLDTELSAPQGPGRHPLPEPDAFAHLLGSKGIAPHHHVVAYDHGPGAIAARLWWMLRSLGHEKVSLLDGGFAHWQQGGYPTDRETPHPQATTYNYQVGAGSTSTINRQELFAQLGAVQIIDARDEVRYRGESDTVDPVRGHIPTSQSAPTPGNLTEAGLFKSPDQLADRFARLGLDPSQPVVSSCGSGVTACHNILALHMAGFPEPILYPGSWSDWSAHYPAVTGEHPGELPSG